MNDESRKSGRRERGAEITVESIELIEAVAAPLRPYRPSKLTRVLPSAIGVVYALLAGVCIYFAWQAEGQAARAYLEALDVSSRVDELSGTPATLTYSSTIQGQYDRALERLDRLGHRVDVLEREAHAMRVEAARLSILGGKKLHGLERRVDELSRWAHETHAWQEGIVEVINNPYCGKPARK